MKFRSVRWLVVSSYLILFCSAMILLGVYLSLRIREDYLDNLQLQMVSSAQVLAHIVAPQLAHPQSSAGLDEEARYYRRLFDARVTLISLDGAVLGESDLERLEMENQLYHPEVQEALTEGAGSNVRFSETAGSEMIYVAVLTTSEGRPAGIVRFARPLDQIQSSIARFRSSMMIAAVLTGVVATLIAGIIAERTIRPVRQLIKVAGRLAEGDLNARLFPTTRDEVGQLTSAFNHMADQFREKVDVLADERGRLAAVLEHMADGVIITGGQGSVRLINPAAARMLTISQEHSLGRSYAQVVRNHQLIELWHACRERSEEQVDTVEMTYQKSFLRAIVTPLREAEPLGCLVILQDLTQVRRLETMRRDFVSNISHELRTPLASLKALVDTLRDGALEDPPAAERFLNSIEVEVDTLTQMVQELLELSRIESGQVPFRFGPTSIRDIVIAPVERLRPQAERAGLHLNLDVQPDLPPVLADAERIRLVVTNIVHNAIKFTPAGGKVHVSARLQGNDVVVEVEDTGVGIPANMLPRIFERFYKADRARSGGGTGLGLAISKHIVQAHGGRIWAESVEGSGSTFFFALPKINQSFTAG